jgi:hypothetical protein
MSNTLAIAAVTSTLQQLLLRVKSPKPGDPPPDPGLVGADVQAKPPDSVTATDAGPILGLFLYHVTHNAQLRNMDVPGQTKPGETGQPPVALDLHFLLTVYSLPDEILGQRLLGWAMRMLHDRAILLPADIKAALPDSDLYRQFERVRLTPHPITTEEMSRLWTIFGAHYRLSVAYQASVVLIDSTRQPLTPLPVLTRTVGASPSVAPPPPPFPALTGVDPQNGQPSARLGEPIVLDGFNLGGSAPTAFFSTPLLTTPISLVVTVNPDGTAATATLPNDAAAQPAWPAGVYTVSESPTGTGATATNAVTFSLAPTITAITPATVVGGKAKLDPSGALIVTLQFSPQVWPVQRLTLLLGSASVDAPARAGKVATFTFTVPAAPLGRQFLRLRVDGVDSLIIDYTATTPVFDLTQSVEIVP